MNDIMLEVKNVSKGFKLRGNRADSLKSWITSAFSPQSATGTKFEALKNVSFNLYRGNALGVIGKNGAGKSTLLRILSGISQPDEGEINFYGKTVSILDIGTGFHPELTGRENVYLSAALYNISRQKIDSRFNEILEFSGIGKFIDEPVKNYSSGMYLRLAFSITSCLDADIFLIDEVINVGDANFQAKCKTKIEELIAAGKTLLIASHNLNEIVSLCNNILLMEDGEIVQSGGTEVILKYVTRALPQHFSFNNDEVFHLKDLSAGFEPLQGLQLLHSGLSNYARLNDGLSAESPFTIFFEFKLTGPTNLVFRIKFYDVTGVLIFTCASMTSLQNITAPGNYKIEFEIPANIFNDRMYSADFGLLDNASRKQLFKAEKFLVLKMASSEQNEDKKILLAGVMKPLVKITLV